MSTGDKFVNFTPKKLVGFRDFRDRFLDYLKKSSKDAISIAYGQDGVFNDTITVDPDGNDGFHLNVGTITPVDPLCNDGLGNFLRLDADLAGRTSAIQFENKTGETYSVGLKYAERPVGVQINTRTGFPEFQSVEETIGESGEPDSVTDNMDGTLTFDVSSVGQPLPADAGMNLEGRKCLVWKTSPGREALTETAAIEELTVSSANTVTTTASPTGAGLFGQPDTAVSIDTQDYKVLMLGPTISRQSLDAETGYVFIAEFDGTGDGRITPTPAVIPSSSWDNQNKLTPVTLLDLGDITSLLNSQLRLHVKAKGSDVEVPQILIEDSTSQHLFSVDEDGDIFMYGQTIIDGTSLTVEVPTIFNDTVNLNGDVTLGTNGTNSHTANGSLEVVDGNFSIEDDLSNFSMQVDHTNGLVTLGQSGFGGDLTTYGTTILGEPSVANTHTLHGDLIVKDASSVDKLNLDPDGETLTIVASSTIGVPTTGTNNLVGAATYIRATDASTPPLVHADVTNTAVGINQTANSSYKLAVTGNTNLTGSLEVGGLTVASTGAITSNQDITTTGAISGGSFTIGGPSATNEVVGDFKVTKTSGGFETLSVDADAERVSIGINGFSTTDSLEVGGSTFNEYDRSLNVHGTSYLGTAITSGDALAHPVVQYGSRSTGRLLTGAAPLGQVLSSYEGFSTGVVSREIASGGVNATGYGHHTWSINAEPISSTSFQADNSAQDSSAILHGNTHITFGFKDATASTWGFTAWDSYMEMDNPEGTLKIQGLDIVPGFSSTGSIGQTGRRWLNLYGKFGYFDEQVQVLAGSYGVDINTNSSNLLDIDGTYWSLNSTRLHDSLHIEGDTLADNTVGRILIEMDLGGVGVDDNMVLLQTRLDATTGPSAGPRGAAIIDNVKSTVSGVAENGVGIFHNLLPDNTASYEFSPRNSSWASTGTVWTHSRVEWYHRPSSSPVGPLGEYSSGESAARVMSLHPYSDNSSCVLQIPDGIIKLPPDTRGNSNADPANWKRNVLRAINIPKAWAVIQVETSGHPFNPHVIHSGHNISSFVEVNTSTPDWSVRVDFDEAFDSPDDYAVFVSKDSSSLAGNPQYFPVIGFKAVDHFYFYVASGSTGSAYNMIANDSVSDGRYMVHVMGLMEEI